MQTRSVASLAREDCHGWVALFCGRSWAARLIQQATGSPYSHVGILAKAQNGRLDLIEVREFFGGRRVTFASQLKLLGVDVHIFRPLDLGWSPRVTVDTMSLMTGAEYGYGSFFQVALRKIPFLWRFARIDSTEALPNNDVRNVRPTCSQAVYIALREGGCIPMRRKPSYLVTPGDLGHSPALIEWGSVSGSGA